MSGLVDSFVRDVMPYLMALVFFAIIIANFVINLKSILIMKRRRLFGMLPNRLFIQWVMIDYICCFLVLLPAAITSIIGSWELSDFVCFVHGVSMTLVYLVVFALLILRCVERTLKIKDKTLYKKIFYSKQKLVIISLVVWLVPLLISLCPAFGLVTISYDYYHAGCVPYAEDSVSFLVLLFLHGIIFLLVTVIVCHILIFRHKDSPQDKQVAPSDDRTWLDKAEKEKQEKLDAETNFIAAMTNFAVCIVMLVLWTPYFLVAFIRSSDTNVWRGAYTCALIPIIITFVVKPTVYYKRLAAMIDQANKKQEDDKKKALAKKKEDAIKKQKNKGKKQDVPKKGAEKKDEDELNKQKKDKKDDKSNKDEINERGSGDASETTDTSGDDSTGEQGQRKAKPVLTSNLIKKGKSRKNKKEKDSKQKTPKAIADKNKGKGDGNNNDDTDIGDDENDNSEQEFSTDEQDNRDEKSKKNSTEKMIIVKSKNKPKRNTNSEPDLSNEDKPNKSRKKNKKKRNTGEITSGEENDATNEETDKDRKEVKRKKGKILAKKSKSGFENNDGDSIKNDKEKTTKPSEENYESDSENMSDSSHTSTKVVKRRKHKRRQNVIYIDESSDDDANPKSKPRKHKKRGNKTDIEKNKKTTSKDVNDADDSSDSAHSSGKRNEAKSRKRGGKKKRSNHGNDDENIDNRKTDSDDEERKGKTKRKKKLQSIGHDGGKTTVVRYVTESDSGDDVSRKKSKKSKNSNNDKNESDNDRNGKGKRRKRKRHRKKGDKDGFSSQDSEDDDSDLSEDKDEKPIIIMRERHPSSNGEKLMAGVFGVRKIRDPVKYRNNPYGSDDHQNEDNSAGQNKKNKIIPTKAKPKRWNQFNGESDSSDSQECSSYNSLSDNDIISRLKNPGKSRVSGDNDPDSVDTRTDNKSNPLSKFMSAAKKVILGNLLGIRKSNNKNRPNDNSNFNNKIKPIPKQNKNNNTNTFGNRGNKTEKKPHWGNEHNIKTISTDPRSDTGNTQRNKNDGSNHSVVIINDDDGLNQVSVPRYSDLNRGGLSDHGESGNDSDSDNLRQNALKKTNARHAPNTLAVIPEYEDLSPRNLNNQNNKFPTESSNIVRSDGVIINIDDGLDDNEVPIPYKPYNDLSDVESNRYDYPRGMRQNDHKKQKMSSINTNSLPLQTGTNTGNSLSNPAHPTNSSGFYGTENGAPLFDGGSNMRKQNQYDNDMMNPQQNYPANKTNGKNSNKGVNELYNNTRNPITQSFDPYQNDQGYSAHVNPNFKVNDMQNDKTNNNNVSQNGHPKEYGSHPVKNYDGSAKTVHDSTGNPVSQTFDPYAFSQGNALGNNNAQNGRSDMQSFDDNKNNNPSENGRGNKFGFSTSINNDGNGGRQGNGNDNTKSGPGYKNGFNVYPNQQGNGDFNNPRGDGEPLFNGSYGDGKPLYQKQNRRPNENKNNTDAFQNGQNGSYGPSNNANARTESGSSDDSNEPYSLYPDNVSNNLNRGNPGANNHDDMYTGDNQNELESSDLKKPLKPKRKHRLNSINNYQGRIPNNNSDEPIFYDPKKNINLPQNQIRDKSNPHGSSNEIKPYANHYNDDANAYNSRKGQNLQNPRDGFDTHNNMGVSDPSGRLLPNKASKHPNDSRGVTNSNQHPRVSQSNTRTGGSHPAGSGNEPNVNNQDGNTDQYPFHSDNSNTKTKRDNERNSEKFSKSQIPNNQMDSNGTYDSQIGQQNLAHGNHPDQPKIGSNTNPHNSKYGNNANGPRPGPSTQNPLNDAFDPRQGNINNPSNGINPNNPRHMSNANLQNQPNGTHSNDPRSGKNNYPTNGNNANNPRDATKPNAQNSSNGNNPHDPRHSKHNNDNNPSNTMNQYDPRPGPSNQGPKSNVNTSQPQHDNPQNQASNAPSSSTKHPQGNVPHGQGKHIPDGQGDFGRNGPSQNNSDQNKNWNKAGNKVKAVNAFKPDKWLAIHNEMNHNHYDKSNVPVKKAKHPVSDIELL